MNLLEVTKLVKTYGGRTVVDGVSFLIAQQEIIGLLGRNGAGKTTTFRMILGMVEPNSGAVAFDGEDITHLPMYKRARRGLGYLSQERSDFRRLTVWQNLMAILETLPISNAQRKARAERLLTQYGLAKLRKQQAHTLSGARRKLEIARALVTEPKLILLDEPFSGVDPIAVEDLQREVLRLKEEFRKSVLITDHNVAQTLRVCDRALIIGDGRVSAEGTPKQIINDPGVRAAYLGNTFRGDEFDEPLKIQASFDNLVDTIIRLARWGSEKNAPRERSPDVLTSGAPVESSHRLPRNFHGISAISRWLWRLL